VTISVTLSAMLIVTRALVAAVLAQQPVQAPKPDLPTLKAGLGSCSADFTVKDADGKPVYLATIHVRIRYGPMNIKRMDLEVSTNDEGKARVEGLPLKARPLAYDIQKGDQKAAVEQNVATTCQATHEVSLK